MTSFRFPLPKKQFIDGEYVDAKSKERLTLRSALDDSIICDGMPLLQ